MPRDDDQSLGDQQTYEGGLPSDWDDRVLDQRERAKLRIKFLDKLILILICAMCVCGFAMSFGFMALGAVLNTIYGYEKIPDWTFLEYWFPVAVAGFSIFGFGTYFAMSHRTGLIGQLNANFVFGGRSHGSGRRNRVVLQSGTDQLHVRVRFGGAAGGAIMLSGIGFLVFAFAVPDFRARIIGGTIGILLGVAYLRMCLLGWRFDFNRPNQTVRIWNWFQKHQLSLSVVDAVEVGDHWGRNYDSRNRVTRYRYATINLRIDDRFESRVHVMCDTANGNAAEKLNEFLFPETE